VVDDEPPVLKIVERLAAKAGFEVAACGSGAEAMRMLARRPADLAMVDLRSSMRIASAPLPHAATSKPAFAARRSTILRTGGSSSTTSSSGRAAAGLSTGVGIASIYRRRATRSTPRDAIDRNAFMVAWKKFPAAIRDACAAAHGARVAFTTVCAPLTHKRTRV